MNCKFNVILKTKTKKVSIIQDIVYLFYPKTCAACGKALLKHEECICTYCLFHLPQTNFHLDKDNRLQEVFWGKAKVENVAALYYYHKGNKVQHLIHQFKYKRKKSIAQFLGEYYGKKLIKTAAFKEIDYIIPIPLHPDKQKIRGYNQSEMIGEGMARGMDKPMTTSLLLRKDFTQTQTKKSRMERWENVKSVFTLQNAADFENKHLLLIDDVITTGSTMEACIQLLLEIKNVKISVACLASAMQ
jgi:ComF family protein